MARSSALPLPVLLILTLGPVALIGATFWISSFLVPACTVYEIARVTAPDGQYDLVTFSRDCGGTGPNVQAAVLPPGEAMPFDGASFFSLPVETDLAPRWTGDGEIELTLPADAEPVRQDPTVAGIDVIYRQR